MTDMKPCFLTRRHVLRGYQNTEYWVLGDNVESVNFAARNNNVFLCIYFLYIKVQTNQ